jgi:hypothetical protein
MDHAHVIYQEPDAVGFGGRYRTDSGWSPSLHHAQRFARPEADQQALALSFGAARTLLCELRDDAAVPVAEFDASGGGRAVRRSA